MTDVIVSVEQGKLQGKVAQDFKGGTYYSFQGIPYAKPPVGELRFQAPQPPEKWTGIRDATQEGSECFSRHMLLQNIIGSEDCLVINVYTPELPIFSTDLKPVMVWIHGGGFTTGSSKTELYGPEFLITEDVVIVTFNYRLGILGFLSFDNPNEGVSGNAGCKDMIMALRWVERNIRNFNGDPNNVTIFGESAGGAAVHLLLLSPLSEGLFHKAIAQSACALNTWVISKTCARKLAEVLGYTSSDEHGILKFLQDQPVEKILEGQELLNEDLGVRELNPFGPVVEKASDKEPAFLTKHPLDIILEGSYKKVPLIFGYTSREGMISELFAKDGEKNFIVKDFEKAVPYFLQLNKGSPLSLETAKKIKEFYYDDEEPTEENIDRYYVLQTDNFFLRDIYRSAKHHAVTSSSPVYLYRFSVDAGLNFIKKLGNMKNPGASHADELGYLFKGNTTPGDIDPGSTEGKTVARMIKLWTAFARSGNPNQKNSIIDVTWQQVDKENVNFLDIGHELTTGVNPEADRMAFWEELFKINPTALSL